MVESVLPLTVAAVPLPYLQRLLPSLGAGSLHCGSHGQKNVCCLCFMSPLQESSSFAVPHKKKNVKTCHCSATLSSFKSLNNYGLNKKTELIKNNETGGRKCSHSTAMFPAEYTQGSFPTAPLEDTNYASGQETYYLQSSCLKINKQQDKHFRSCFSIHSTLLP